MSTIEFVVRGDAGVVQRGAIGGNAGQNVVVGADQDISLNLQRSHILSYTRQGQALEITLVDGQVITIEGFFGADGTTENQLAWASSQCAQNRRAENLSAMASVPPVISVLITVTQSPLMW